MLLQARFLRLTVCLSIVAAIDAARAEDSPVAPIRLRGGQDSSATAMQERLYVAAEKQLHALLPQVHAWEEDPSLRLITKSVSGEHGIRPNTAMIDGMAMLYRFGPYDEKLTGISRADLLQRELLPMLRYCIETHKTGNRVTSDGKPWGDAWQSAHWAQMLGNAAWLIWDDLPADCRAGVRRLVAHEADRFVNTTPPHNLRGDTKAEENAWNAQVMNVATVLMPDDPRCEAWEKGFQRWALSAFLRPADETSEVVVDGKTVAEQFTGANIYDDFTLENHGIVHPDYMSTYEITLACSLRYALAGRKPPEALRHNVGGIYENLKWFALPGGGRIYPNGQDWELFRDPRWVSQHVTMAVFARDPDAWQLAKNSLWTLEKMQRRDESGDILRDDEIQYPGARYGLVKMLGQAWLTLAVADEIVDAPQELVGVRRFDGGKIIVQRTPHVVNSFSWGAQSMAMCVPLRLDRVVSPSQRSGVGRIYLDGSDEPLPVRTVNAEVTNDADTFDAKVVIEHGDNLIRSELCVSTDADGAMTWRETLVAGADVTTQEIATGLVGILNNAHWVYEKAQRVLSVNGEEIIIPALSGKKVVEHGVTELAIDSALRITGRNPLSVAYRGARKVERGRATDELILNFVGGRRQWKAGERISEYEVRITAGP